MPDNGLTPNELIARGERFMRMAGGRVETADFLMDLDSRLHRLEQQAERTGRPVLLRTCPVCKDPFEHTGRIDRIYCGERCRHKQQNARRPDRNRGARRA